VDMALLILRGIGRTAYSGELKEVGDLSGDGL
jgi:hypothetical protein